MKQLLYQSGVREEEQAFTEAFHAGRLSLEEGKNGIDEEVRKKINEFFGTKIQEILKNNQTIFNFFWHGWASDRKAQNEEILKKLLAVSMRGGNFAVGILPDGMGISGGCLTQKIKDQECFTPEDYGKQQAAFTNTFFDWDHVINNRGFSMGGAGGLWEPLTIIENDRYRTKNGELPDIRFWYFSPAYPAEANEFINQLLNLGVTTLDVLDPYLSSVSRPIGAGVTYAINRNFVPLSSADVHFQHTGVAVSNPEVTRAAMNGLKLQQPLTEKQWVKILAAFPIYVHTSPRDKMVNQNVSLPAINDLTNRAIMEDTISGVFQIKMTPLILTEDNMPKEEIGDHHVAADNQPKASQLKAEYIKIIGMDGKERIVLSPGISMYVLLNHAPKERIPGLMSALQKDFLDNQNQISGRDDWGRVKTIMVQMGINMKGINENIPFRDFFYQQMLCGAVSKSAMEHNVWLAAFIEDNILPLSSLAWSQQQKPLGIY